jgi:hypothetical protein
MAETFPTGVKWYNVPKLNGMMKSFQGFTPSSEWLKQHVDDVVEWINSKYTNPNTKGLNLCALVELCQLLDKDIPVAHIKKMATSAKTQYHDRMKTHQLSEQEQSLFHSFECLSMKREQHLKQWAHSHNVRDMYRALILSVVTLQPPLRTGDYLHMLITNDAGAPFESALVDGQLFIIKKPSKVKTYSCVLELIPELVDIIHRSLEQYPRTWLFSDPRDSSNPMTQRQWGEFLNSVYPKVSSVCTNTIRSAYCSFMSERPLTFKERLINASALLHCLGTEENIYVKLNINDTCYLPSDYDIVKCNSMYIVKPRLIQSNPSQSSVE